MVKQFGVELVLENIADLRDILGEKRYRSFFIDSMGAVEYKIAGKKELFIPGSESNYPLKEVMAFLSDLINAVDVRVLVASHDDSEQSQALVHARGGRGAVGKSLLQFRSNLAPFLKAHSSVLFGKDGKVSLKDGENQLVLIVKQLHSCGVIKAELTCDAAPLAWVRRDDHGVTLARKAPAVVVEGIDAPPLTPCALVFSPPGRTLAPACPPWLVDCDAADVVNLPLFAVVEVIITMRDEIGDVDPTQSAWCLVMSLWHETCLPTPFNRTGNPQGLSKADVHGLVQWISRSGGNTNASGHRADLLAKVEIARESHLGRMAKALPLAMVSQLFPESTPLLLHWFPAVPVPPPTRKLVTFSPEWLKVRQAKWRPKWRDNFSSGSSAKWPDLQCVLQRTDDRVTNMCDVPSAPFAVPWISKHPSNCQAWMPDAELAMLRHIQAECHLSASQVPLTMSLFYSFFFRSPIPTQLLISEHTFSLGGQRLHERDEMYLAETFQAACRNGNLYYMLTDDTHSAVEEHQIQVAVMDSRIGQPAFFLLECKMGLQKAAASNAALNIECLDGKDIPIFGLGGGSGDRPSLVEYAEMAALLSQAGPVDPRRDPHLLALSEVLLLALPGQSHTCALDWKHFSRGVWGDHVGLADRTHPVQFLHTLKYVWTKSSLEHCRQARAFAGGEDGVWDCIPKDPNVGRWLYVSIAARHVNMLRADLRACGRTLHGLLVHM